MISHIDRAELKNKIEAAEPFVLLEVLPQEEYAKEHLPGALHLPPDGVREVAPTLIPNRQTESRRLLRQFGVRGLEQSSRGPRSDRLRASPAL